MKVLRSSFYSLCMCVMLLVSMLFSATAANNITPSESVDSSKSETAIWEQTVAHEESLIEAYNTMLKYFNENPNDKYMYPEDFAGAYIQDGALYIGLTDTSELNTAIYSQLCYPVVPKYVLKEYSLNSLQALKNEIEESLHYDYEISGIYPEENKVKIGVSSKNVESARQRIISSEKATYVASNHLPVEIYSSDTFRTNQTIYGGDSLALVTAGIGGTYKGEPAILTCGHGYDVGDELIDKNGNALVRFVKNQFKDYQYYDYGIAQVVSDDIIPSNKVRTSSGTRKITSINKSPVPGMSIEVYGYSSKYLTGLVVGIDVSAKVEDKNGNDRIIYGLVETSAETTFGDSGGPCYAGSNLYGTVSAGDGRRMLFSPSGAVSGFEL